MDRREAARLELKGLKVLLRDAELEINNPETSEGRRAWLKADARAWQRRVCQIQDTFDLW